MNAHSNLLAPEIRDEIAAVEIELADQRRRYDVTPGWFTRLPLRSKANIASIISFSGLLAVTGLALLGFAYPAWIENIRIVLVIVAALAMMAGFAARREIYNQMVEPFLSIKDGMTRLANGDRDIVVTDTARDDEVGEMARALEIFVKSGRKLDELYTGRKEASRKRKSDLIELARKFENSIGDVVGGVAAASTQLQSTARSMATSAEQSASQTQQVARSMERASEGVTAAASASDEFAMSIGEISRQATNSAELARRATKNASSADETISALAASADQVGQIVELIQSIAQRTNLLALNASIEAARGGEAGRGFAVVASEVKELAAQTSRATEEVAEQIRTMQDSTGASVSALRSIGDQIKELETTATSIASAVDQQSVAGRDLARSIDLAARSTDEVSANVAQVRETSVATGAAASQVLGSANELEAQAQTLREQVDGFLAQVRAD